MAPRPAARCTYPRSSAPRPVICLSGFVLCLVALGSLSFWSELRAAATIRCESVDFRDNYCAAETRGGVRISRQISRAPCRQGSSWGYDRHGIWVTEGCGAEFELAAPGGDQGQGSSPGRSDRGAQGTRHGGDEEITCESHDYRYHYCPVRNTREVELVRQLSSSSCRFKRSWGYDRGGIWVDQGCGAVFVTRQ